MNLGRASSAAQPSKLKEQTTMSTTFIQAGEVMTFTAPTGGVTAGTPVLIGGLLVVPRETVAQTLPFDGDAEGVHALPKADSQAWTEGAVIYWDNAAKNCTTVSTANYRVGVAAAAVASTAGLTTGLVRLNGVGVTAVAGVAP
jgi:predicted RecA/RadA family phage recombinase